MRKRLVVILVAYLLVLAAFLCDCAGDITSSVPADTQASWSGYPSLINDIAPPIDSTDTNYNNPWGDPND